MIDKNGKLLMITVFIGHFEKHQLLIFGVSQLM